MQITRRGLLRGAVAFVGLALSGCGTTGRDMKDGGKDFIAGSGGIVVGFFQAVGGAFQFVAAAATGVADGAANGVSRISGGGRRREDDLSALPLSDDRQVASMPSAASAGAFQPVAFSPPTAGDMPSRQLVVYQDGRVTTPDGQSVGRIQQTPRSGELLIVADGAVIDHRGEAMGRLQSVALTSAGGMSLPSPAEVARCGAQYCAKDPADPREAWLVRLANQHAGDLVGLRQHLAADPMSRDNPARVTRIVNLVQYIWGAYRVPGGAAISASF